MWTIRVHKWVILLGKNGFSPNFIDNSTMKKLSSKKKKIAMKCSVTLENLGDIPITILVFLFFNRLQFVVVVYWLKWLDFEVETYLLYELQIWLVSSANNKNGFFSKWYLDEIAWFLVVGTSYVHVAINLQDSRSIV